MTPSILHDSTFTVIYNLLIPNSDVYAVKVLQRQYITTNHICISEITMIKIKYF